ncbi:MAG TPA: hypothetical protein VFZ61_05745 [Polyangiales bacterium]
MCALFATTLVCASVPFLLPRPGRLELPVLQLDRAAVAAQLTEDEVLARPPSTPLGQELYRKLLERGRAEFAAGAMQLGAAKDVFAPLRARIHSELDPNQLRALQAYATQRFMRALRSGIEDADEERGVVGAQYSQLLRHGYIAPSGVWLAPELSLRATYKVRLNLLLGLAPDSALSRIERLAYQGYRALEAREMPPAVRAEAISQLLELAPEDTRVHEALVIARAQAGDPSALLAYLQSPEGRHASLRLRNSARSVQP